MLLPPQFNIFSERLRHEMLQQGMPKTIPAGVEILRAGQFIQAVPIVLKGLVKVITRHEDREFLLYYIHPNESCIMSFFGVIQEESSKIVAITESETELLLLPSEQVRLWAGQYPEFNVFFISSTICAIPIYSKPSTPCCLIIWTIVFWSFSAKKPAFRMTLT